MKLDEILFFKPHIQLPIRNTAVLLASDNDKKITSLKSDSIFEVRISKGTR